MRSTPKLRFKGFSDEWEEKKLGELLEFKNGINADKESYGKGVKFINVLDILSNNYITAEKIIGRVDIDEDTLQKYGVNYGDVLFQRSSETREEVGTANVYLDSETVTFGGFVIRGKKIGNYEPSFMNSLLKSSSARKEITTKSGGSTRYNVGQEILSAVELKFPSLEEQEKIAKFLTKVDKIIEKQDEKVNNLEQYKKGMMQKIFSQEIRFKKEDGGEYPEWQTNKLSSICDIIMGQSPNSEFYNEEFNGMPLIQGNADMKNRRTSPRVYTSSITKTCKVGDIIMSVRAPAGTIAISEHEACIGRGVCAIRVQEKNKFIYQLLLMQEDKWSKFSQGSTFDSINSSDINDLMVNLPCLEEQIKIANFLSKIDSIVEKEKEKLKELRELKKGLLQGMFV